MRFALWSQTVNKRLQAGAFLTIAILAGFAGFHFSRERADLAVVEGAAQRLMSVSVTDLDGNPQALSQWRGKVLVVNFWATWCAPCREEMPALMRVQRKYAINGVKLVGISLDNASNVRKFADEMQIDYTLLVGGIETLDLSRGLGNRAGVLPFTVVLDRAGTVAYAHAGALTEAELAATLAPLL
jgi:thiol-disulfide isomerase/thioredoxin